MEDDLLQEAHRDLNGFLFIQVSENLKKLVSKTEPFKHWLSNAVLSKERPETAAISPVIANISFNSLTSLVTVNNKGDAFSMSANENGTLLANSFIVLNANAESSTLPVRNFNLTCKLSTSDAV